MKFQPHTLPACDPHLHVLEDNSTIRPANTLFRFNETEDGTSTIVLEAATGPSGPINFSMAYRLTIPKEKVYRITYHYHWDGHDRNYIGFYDEKRDNHLPMYQYTGGSGYGSREFTLPAQSEDLDYIIHGHLSKRIGLHNRPWVQVPAKLSTDSTNTIIFADDPSQRSEIGWLSWGIMTTG